MSTYPFLPCPRCQGPTTDHCSLPDCRLLRCEGCGAFGVEGGQNWSDLRPWDKDAPAA